MAALDVLLEALALARFYGAIVDRIFVKDREHKGNLLRWSGVKIARQGNENCHAILRSISEVDRSLPTKRGKPAQTFGSKPG